ncbi:MAG: hypothetical protein ACKVJP_13555, partial [Flavobacteriales bacterium]
VANNEILSHVLGAPFQKECKPKSRISFHPCANHDLHVDDFPLHAHVLQRVDGDDDPNPNVLRMPHLHHDNAE